MAWKPDPVSFWIDQHIMLLWVRIYNKFEKLSVPHVHTLSGDGIRDRFLWLTTSALGNWWGKRARWEWISTGRRSFFYKPPLGPFEWFVNIDDIHWSHFFFKGPFRWFVNIDDLHLVHSYAGHFKLTQQPQNQKFQLRLCFVIAIYFQNKFCNLKWPWTGQLQNCQLLQNKDSWVATMNRTTDVVERLPLSMDRRHFKGHRKSSDVSTLFVLVFYRKAYVWQ